MNTLMVASRSRGTYDLIRQIQDTGLLVADYAPDLETLMVRFANRRYDFTFVDLGLLEPLLEGESYEAVMRRFLDIFPAAQVIILAEPDQVHSSVELVKAGASNYILYPLNQEEILYVLESIQRSLLMEMELNLLRDTFWGSDTRDLISTRNPVMKEVFSKVKSVAATNATVLLQGETGTGKNIIARLIHSHSARKRGPFISVHCGAIPPSLIESELFGHEKGAFTGATRRKLGRFEIARNGTIFLDEIGTTPLSVQVELLQILQEKTFTRVGGELPIAVDVRIIAASNENLKDLCEKGLFRTDLYYRLNVFPIDLPSLNDRIEDIPLFVDHFIGKFNRTYGKQIRGVDVEVLRVLEGYPWPGNLRELENVMERACILETGESITLSVLPSDLVAHTLSTDHSAPEFFLPIADARQRSVDRFERLYLTQLLGHNGGRIDRTAASAGITTRQLQKLMKKHGIRKEGFRRNRP